MLTNNGEVEVYLDTREVAKTINVPESTVRYWRHLGVGPQGIRLGKHVRYRASDLNQWINARAAGTGAA